MRVRLVGSFLAVAAMMACKDGNGPQPIVYQLTIHSGDDQQGPAGSELGQPLAVTVKDPANQPTRGVRVRFRVTGGVGATLGDTVVTSGIDGVARVTVRLGPSTGSYTFLAFLPNNANSGVPFSAEATAPPTLTSVTPTTFTTGDTLTLVGTDFNPSLPGNIVYVGGVRARIVDGVGDTQLRVIAPACLTAGTVQVRVLVGTAPTNSVNATFSAASGLLALGELDGITVSGAEVANCLRLPGGGARYLFVPSFASVDTGAVMIDFTLGPTEAASPGDPVVASAPLEGLNPMQAAFDTWLRRQEHYLAPTAQTGAREVESSPRGLEAVTLGSTRQFKVLGNLEGTSFVTSTARLKYIGTNVYVYLDVNAPTGFSDAELNALGQLFDQTLYTLAVNAFGAESDLDQNGHIIVLLSQHINALTPSAQCSGGFVTGYFFGWDLVSTASTSNKGEVFYALVPDPGGAHSCAHSKDAVQSIVPSTFIHEFQHMISFNQHVLVRGGSDEDVWLNEGLSHIAEELASRYYEDKCPPPSCRTDPNQIFPDSASKFINGNLFDAYAFLQRTDTASITTFRATGNLAERGGAWLFLRWLGDQKGQGIYGQLVQTSKTSILNIQEEAGESFAALFGDFAIAVYTDSIIGVPRASVPQRYRFTTRNFRQIYKRLFDLGRVPLAYPLNPPTISAGSPVTSSMLVGTMKHYLMTTSSGSASVALQFSRSGGGAFAPALESQLGVFRLPPP